MRALTSGEHATRLSKLAPVIRRRRISAERSGDAEGVREADAAQDYLERLNNCEDQTPEGEALVARYEPDAP